MRKFLLIWTSLFILTTVLLFGSSAASGALLDFHGAALFFVSLIIYVLGLLIILAIKLSQKKSDK